MIEWLHQHHRVLLLVELGFGLATLLVLRWLSAPYGRHMRAGWGPTVSNRVGWMCMEAPSAVFFLWIYSSGDAAWDVRPLLLLAFWQLHYTYRTFVFPFRLRSGDKRMPVLIAATAVCFNTLNSAVNASWISSHHGTLEPNHPWVLGLCIMVLGWAINLHSDQVLFDLRSPGDRGYYIPRGGFYRWVSAPNYLGEMMVWAGWAIDWGSWAGYAFFLFTIANLLPRALEHHAWYRTQFPDYPPDRKAIIPGIL